MSTRLTLRDSRWYGWQMLPGYGSGYHPYFSPIYIQRVEPLKTGLGWLKLTFFNALYAQGVQTFDEELAVVTREESYLIARLSPREPSGRSVVISNINASWLKRFVYEAQDFSGRENALSDEGCQEFLEEKFLR